MTFEVFLNLEGLVFLPQGSLSFTQRARSISCTASPEAGLGYFPSPRFVSS